MNAKAERARNAITILWTTLNEGCAIEPSLESIGLLVEEFDGALHGLVLASLFLPISHPEALEEVCKHIDEDIHPAFYESPLLVPGAHEDSAELGTISLSKLTTTSPAEPSNFPPYVISIESYSPTRLSLKALHELLPLDSELGAGTRPLSLRSLRSWLSLMNATIIEAEGSELRLRFRYAALPLLCVFFSQVSMGFPEFVSKVYDYIDNWARRRTFDAGALDILYECVKGRMAQPIPLALRHARAEITSSFVKLRAEMMSGGVVDQRNASSAPDGEIQDPQNPANNSALAAVILPKPLLDLIDEWESNDPPTAVDNGSSAQVRDWYGDKDKLVDVLVQLREEIQEKFATLLAKHEHCYLHEEIERTKPQTMVLLKRELTVRAKIVYQLVKMITSIDLRHAQLAQSLHHFTKLLRDLGNTTA